MNYATLIDATTLKQQLDKPGWVIVDCRFSLGNAEAGGSAYRHGHLPNARYAHLDKDLSSSMKRTSGRHPLPDFRVLVNQLRAWGIGNNSQVVAYDDAGGVFAGRLWWLLRALGHERVAVLDGGICHWQKLGHPITTALPRPKPAQFRGCLNTAMWVDALQLENALAKKNLCLLDARLPERFSGRHEPIDPVAGHIPGAINRPFQHNLDDKGNFLPAKQLKEQFKQLTGDTPAEQTVHYCGSGVTACHNILAMEHAGLTGSKLYAGSWSEWIRNKNRPVACCH